MSVLVKGMKMPETCNECYLHEKNVCPILRCIVEGYYRPSICPLVEVPPHGRLINADDAVVLLRAHKQESMSKGLLLAADEDAIIRWLDKLPTVIAAEEGL